MAAPGLNSQSLEEVDASIAEVEDRRMKIQNALVRAKARNRAGRSAEDWQRIQRMELQDRECGVLHERLCRMRGQFGGGINVWNRAFVIAAKMKLSEAAFGELSDAADVAAGCGSTGATKVYSAGAR